MKRSKKIITKKSYGVACFKYDYTKNKLEVLMIKKRTTFSFVDFVLGKYRSDDTDHILYLLNRMTCDEKLDLCSLDFGKIWYRIWLVDPDFGNLKNSKDKQEKYNTCKLHFHDNFLRDRGERLKNLINQSSNSETLWELPKGKMAYAQEKKLSCAIREFEEETKISNSQYYIIPDEIYRTQHQSGRVRYVCEYYIAIINSDSKYNNPKNLKVDYCDSQHIAEVTELQWMDINKIKSLNTHGLHNIITLMIRNLRKKYKIKFLFEVKNNLK
jgi:8-oxo-dGTP pyrophosphatase MutT (NUDIX family)